MSCLLLFVTCSLFCLLFGIYYARFIMINNELCGSHSCVNLMVRRPLDSITIDLIRLERRRTTSGIQSYISKGI